jgi:hypothetical protein
VVTVIGVGLRNEKKLVKKKPPFAVIWGRIYLRNICRELVRGRTRDVNNNVQGDEFIMGDAFDTTVGGMREHRSMLRVKPSTIASGSSVLNDGEGTAGRYSTTACTVAYRAGVTPDTMNEGGIPSNGAATASPPYTTISVVEMSFTKDLGGRLAAPFVWMCCARSISLICRRAMHRRNAATTSRVLTPKPNHENGAMGCSAYWYSCIKGVRDMVVKRRRRDESRFV